MTRTSSSRLASFLYHSSFTLFLLITAALLLASASGLGEQAWLSGQRRWNILVLVAAYVALAIISIVHVWSRLLSVKKILRTMPKPYIPTKHIDIPKTVSDLIQTEYSRTAVIAHISQATTGRQEGWGRPGTKWETIHFRTYILSTYELMRSALSAPTSPPFALDALVSKAESIDPGPLTIFVNSYAAIVERARYARTEPDEADALAVEKVVELVRNLIEVKKRGENGAETERSEIEAK